MIIKKVNTLHVDDKNLHVNDVFIENINNYGVRSLSIYCIAEDTNTHEESKIKITIQGQYNYRFDKVSDEDWDEHCGENYDNRKL